MNIRQRINEVRKAVSYVQKDSVVSVGGGSYKAVSHDNVLAAIRSAVVEHGISIEPSLKSHTWYEPRKGKEQSQNWLYEAVYKVRFVNIEEPNDQFSVKVSGHANDTGDKAAGKALSYAVKNALLKVFFLETGVDDESRNFDPSEYTADQKAMYDELLINENAQGFYCYCLTLPDQIRVGLHNSFAAGEKSKYKSLARKLEKIGSEAVDELTANIQAMVDDDDPAVLELTDELELYEKQVVVKRLRPGDVKYLASLSGGV